jgi:hypothetical protein
MSELAERVNTVTSDTEMTLGQVIYGTNENFRAVAHIMAQQGMELKRLRKMNLVLTLGFAVLALINLL